MISETPVSSSYVVPRSADGSQETFIITDMHGCAAESLAHAKSLTCDTLVVFLGLGEEDGVAAPHVALEHGMAAVIARQLLGHRRTMFVLPCFDKWLARNW